MIENLPNEIMNSKYTKQVVVEYYNWNKNIHKENHITGLDKWPIV